MPRLNRMTIIAGAVAAIAPVAAGTPLVLSRDRLNGPGTDNRQLAINIMHWLSRLRR